MNEVFAQAAEGAAPAAAGGNEGLLLVILMWGIVIYFFLLRPQKKKEKQRKSLLDNLKKKDEVITVGGIMGKVEGIIDDVVSLKIADSAVIKVQRNAISQIVTAEDTKEKK